MAFVLASASPARLAVLRAAGVEPIVQISGVDESSVTGDAEAVALELAIRKAASVAAHRPRGDLVLGCDSVLDFDGSVLGKPRDAADAKARWQAMRGRHGALLTGHCLIDTGNGERVTAVAATTVRFGNPSDAELDAYIASGEPLRVAGAFTIDGLGGWFIEGIDGDPGTVVGLSLPLLRRLLARLGHQVVDLW